MTKTVGKLFGYDPDHREFACSDRLVCNNTSIGVEIELENVTEPFTHTLWQGVRDGSLRNHGAEFIFNGPLRGADIYRALRAFGRWSSAHPAVEVSDRCSIHVHMDVRDMSKRQLHAILSMYIALERVLFHFVGEERANNNFCTPCFSAVTLEKDLHKILNDDRDFINVVRRSEKYWACNVRSISERGTIEFRQHAGTADYERILLWVNILLCVKKAGLRMANIPLAQHMSRLGVDRFMFEVFGDLNKHLRYPGLEDDVYKGLRFLDHIGLYSAQDSIEDRMVYVERDTRDDLLMKFADSNKRKYLKASKPKKPTKKLKSPVDRVAGGPALRPTAGLRPVTAGTGRVTRTVVTAWEGLAVDTEAPF